MTFPFIDGRVGPKFRLKANSGGWTTEDTESREGAGSANRGAVSGEALALSASGGSAPRAGRNQEPLDAVRILFNEDRAGGLPGVWLPGAYGVKGR